MGQRYHYQHILPYALNNSKNRPKFFLLAVNEILESGANLTCDNHNISMEDLSQFM